MTQIHISLFCSISAASSLSTAIKCALKLEQCYKHTRHWIHTQHSLSNLDQALKTFRLVFCFRSWCRKNGQLIFNPEFPPAHMLRFIVVHTPCNNKLTFIERGNKSTEWTLKVTLLLYTDYSEQYSQDKGSRLQYNLIENIYIATSCIIDIMYLMIFIFRITAQKYWH